MLVKDYFQRPIPSREEVSMAYEIFLEDYGRWYSAMGGPRPFRDSQPCYVQIAYAELFANGGNVCLRPDTFDPGQIRLRAATCAAAMIDQDMHQLFHREETYKHFRNRFVFPKTDYNLPPIYFVDEAILENVDLVGLMKCLYLLVFRWLKDQTCAGGDLTRRLYGQLRQDNAGREGLRGILWTRIFADVP